MSLPPSTTASASRGPARIAEVHDADEWNTLVDTMPGGFATQLWEWGEARRVMGWEPYRLVIATTQDPGDPPAAALQVLVRRLPVLGWGIGYASRGPMGLREPGAADGLDAALRGWARRRRLATVVVDPTVAPGEPLAQRLVDAPWRLAPTVGENRVHVLRLDPSVDPWPAVHRKHREWIRRAERAGVEVTWADAASTDGEAAAALARFDAVYARMVARLPSLPHHPRLTRALWERLRRSGRAHIVTATHEGIPVAAMFHIVYGDEMLWYSGGAAEGDDRLGAGKLLVWRAIERARGLGLGRYHMWGTATDGLARYKSGFGAREERYIGTRALSVHPAADALIRALWGAQRVGRDLRVALASRPGRRARPSPASGTGRRAGLAGPAASGSGAAE